AICFFFNQIIDREQFGLLIGFESSKLSSYIQNGHLPEICVYNCTIYLNRSVISQIRFAFKIQILALEDK
ncbi:MAG: hypothetical protein ACJAUD_000606, partial [Crocinitomicaceae bacterium]